MAVSKNNRRKKRKRTQNHSAPVTSQQIAKEQKIDEEKQIQEKKRLRLSIIAIVIMMAGLLVAWKVSRFFGYPLTFVGGVIGLVTARLQDKGRKVTIVCYTVYCILIAYMWIFEFMVG